MLLFTCMILCCSLEYTGYLKEQSSAKSDIKGKVASIIEIAIDTHLRGKNNEVIDTLEIRYDTSGKKTFTFYATQEHIYVKHTNIKNNKVYYHFYNLFNYNDKHQLTKRIKYAVCFDSTGRRIERDRYNNEFDTITTRYQYDKYGNEIEQRTSRTKTNIEEIKLSYYDSLNNLISEYLTTSIETPDLPSERWIYGYDDKNNERIVYNSIVVGTDTLLVWIDFYDKKGNNIRTTSYNKGHEGLTSVYYTDDDHRLIKEEVKQPKDWEDAPNSITTYIYANFDRHGNYLKKISSKGREYTRIIEYYE